MWTCLLYTSTDAYRAGLTSVDEATKEMCGQVIYPAAVLKAAPNAEAAKAVSYTHLPFPIKAVVVSTRFT